MVRTASPQEAYRNPQAADLSSDPRRYNRFDATTLDNLHLTPEEAHLAHGLFRYALRNTCSPIRLFNQDALRLQDFYTLRHSIRVSRMGLYVLLRTGERERLAQFMIAAYLHDYGKFDPDIQEEIYIPDLSPAARKRVDEHPSRALHYFAVKQLPPDGRGVAAYHHGYKRKDPYGADSSKIPASLRNPFWEQVVAATDVLDAVSSPRPYREWTAAREEAITTVEQEVAVEPIIIQSLSSLVLGHTLDATTLPPARRAYYLAR